MGMEYGGSIGHSISPCCAVVAPLAFESATLRANATAGHRKKSLTTIGLVPTVLES